jgi:hypothetical protein
MSQRRFWGASLLLLFVFVQSACAGQTMVEDAAETRTRTAVAALPTASPPPLSPTGEANADVRFVEARQDAGGNWTFTVTVAHPDQGWEDYADGWDIVLPDGSVVKPDPDSPFTRLLLHPHETEQPFTRSLGGIVIPEGVTTVTVRAHDLVDGFGGQEIQVDLTADSGPGFEVQR